MVLQLVRVRGTESRDGVVLSKLKQAASTTATATTSETAATAVATAAAATIATIPAQQPICAAAATGRDPSWSFTTEHIFPAFNHLSPAIAYDPDGDGISVI